MGVSFSKTTHTHAAGTDNVYRPIPSTLPSTQPPTHPSTTRSHTHPPTQFRDTRRIVLCGGGVKGLAHLGALSAMGPLDGVTAWAGTSAGAMLAALLALGWTVPDLIALMEATDFRSLLDEPLTPVHYLADALRVWRHDGANSGHAVYAWLGDMVARAPWSHGNPDVTFAELWEARKVDLRLMATDVWASYHGSCIDAGLGVGSGTGRGTGGGVDNGTGGGSGGAGADSGSGTGSGTGADSGSRVGGVRAPDNANGTVVFAHDTTPGVPIRVAVRASMSIPFLFQPVHFQDGARARLLVDGGMLDNFPLDAFKAMEDRATIGLLLVPEEAPYQVSNSESHESVADFAMDLVNTWQAFATRTHVQNAMQRGNDWVAQARGVKGPVILRIRVPHIPLTTFHLTEAQKKHLLQCGRECVL